ncbi:tetratricopeptide repeat protein [Nannocystaceae bacterium ST9]
MTEHELDRWTTLVVAEARGRSLTPEARAERRRIEREQPELSGEASLWAEFAELEQARPREQDDDAMIADVLARAGARAAVEDPPNTRVVAAPRRRSAIGVASLLIGLAACVLLGLAIAELRERGSEAVDRGTHEPLGGAAMALEPHTELRIASAGQHRLADDECRRAGAGARLCTREQVEFRVGEHSSPHHVAIELEQGLLQIDATVDDTLVEVSTPAGVIRTHGIVELRFDPITGELDVDVIAGEAELVRGEVTPLRLGMGAALSLVAGRPHNLDPAELVPAPSEPPAPAKSTRASEPEPESEPSRPSADERLAAAQRALAEGESGQAIERYQTLIAEYPESRAAQIGSVSLGRLQLRQGRANEALAAFERYLESGASELIEEARYGRIRALRELGRKGDADEAIAAFLVAHPGSIHRERLEAWRTP